ncbi:fibronectin type III domain protein [Bacteroides finegoldii CAG:203]|mgnify:FL=1|uniref:golvesin C-terminal-like domain-containing protein n=1 Tax=Bacteroides finegoldii TaxID=338188 RepID=UPI000337811E|nr:fibronectin type III domain protein [Bacteroides finegoldii]CDC51530.1 fibronectin type III domain protein [Bacteroides finegoldii CAG:203]
MKIIVFFLCLTLGVNFLSAQDIERNVKERLTDYFGRYTTTAKISTPKLKSVDIDYERKTIAIHASESFAYQPFRPETVEAVYNQVKELLPGPVHYYRLTIFADGKPIEELIPNIYRNKKKDKERMSLKTDYKDKAWVKNISRPNEISRGLQDRHIAIWQSHGNYFKNDKNEWGWQRPRLFCTTEDLFTQSFVLPYVIPMLENAGAIVYTPRERDTQKNEIIVDNDTPNASLYLEVGSKKAHWATAPIKGFAQKKAIYRDGENPFTDGTCRFIPTERKKKNKDQAFAEWVPTLPAKGEYAVYVSYRTLPNSVSDAKYLVFHNGGVTEFKVNQKIGGGTWVYLGTFEFDKGNNDYGMVVLSNESSEHGVVCADAVRFGGGMGNIERGGKTSGLPRYLEGARYSAQWAGMPYEVYAGRKGENDYADDINTRSNTINYLSGGSVYNPQQPGLGIPLEMTMALHSDAGCSKTDELIGSLGIYTTDFNNGKLNTGIDRYASRDLADILLTQIQKDIYSSYNLSWTRRSMWNRNYSETRLPATPSTIIELLSHQNFADMQLGHDPNFKFTVGRAIYKGILQFVAGQHDKEYVVQPLPVSNFAIRFGKKKNTLELSWKGENDPQEPTAQPREYIVYTRIGYGGFDNGTLVSKTSHTVKIEPGLVYSFKVTAVNRGGESFPSEILSAYKAKRERERVLIINGFDRVSGPAVINTFDKAGFDLEQDPGVPYLSNISFSGAQIGFDRAQAGKEGEGSLGYSGSELEGMKIAGNTFDYPFIHGKAIQAAGKYSFVSCSDEAVENGTVTLEDYPVVDYILGMEKEDPVHKVYYKTFSSAMQRIITSYCQSGGNLFVSGAYVGSDMSGTQGNREFTEKILKYGYQSSMTDKSSNRINGLGRTITIPRVPNETSYAVPAPDCIVPVDTAFPVFTYVPGNQSAGIAYKGNYRTFVLGFPFESIQSEADRATIMAGILGFFTQR